jgi:hypothetical protein
MKVIPNIILEFIVLAPKPFGDYCDFLFGNFNARTFDDVTSLDISFVQNHN